MLSPEVIRERLLAALPGSEIEVYDTTGTGDHFAAQVVSPAFEGKAMLAQHRMTYAPVQDLIDSGALHALALKTYSPSQWAKAQQG